jgi:RNA polymerase sigma factor (sigma-70 family)
MTTTRGPVTDADELERFCADAYPKLVGALSHQFGDRWLAEELAQEALVRVCDHWPRVRGLSSPVGWAFRVGVNLGRSRMRRRASERRARQRHGPERTVHRDSDTADRMAVQHALAQLTPAQREAVVLRYFLDLTAEETAEATGSSAGAVRGLTFRAMRVLRDALDVHGDDQETADAS